MKIEVKGIDPSGSLEDVIYKILLLYEQPLHYKKIKEILIEVGYYELNGRNTPKDYTAIFRSLRIDGRFVRFDERGYYGLKELNLASNISTGVEMKYNNTEREEIQFCDKTEVKNGSEINIQESEFNMLLNNNVILANEKMNANEMIDPEGIMKVGILDIFKANCSEEEIEEIMERARSEYYGLFLPRFLATELNRIADRNESGGDI